MKRSNKLFILLGVLVALCAATFAAMQFQEKKEQIKTSGETVLSVDPDTISALTFSGEKGSFSFHRDDEGSWLYDDDEAFPVDQEKIADLLAVFEDFGAAFTIEEAEDLSQYGLDDPVCTITLTGADEAGSYEIKLGDFSKMDEERYVSTGDGNVYLAAADPYDSYDTDLSGVIKNDKAPSFDETEEIAFSGKESYTIRYEEDSTDTVCEEDVYFTEQGGKNRPLDTDLVEDYLDTIEYTELEDYVNYKVTDEELADYGLDDPELVITVHYTEDADSKDEKSGSADAESDAAGADNPFILQISRDPAEREQAEKDAAKKAEADAAKAPEDDTTDAEADEDEDEEITAYARVGESNIIYRITGNAYKNLMKASYNDLRHKELFTADFDDVTGIQVTLGDESYEITSKEDGKERTYLYNGEEIDAADLQSALEDVAAEEFTDEAPSQKEEIRMTLALDEENHPACTIALYRYDGSDCLMQLDGETVGLCPRSQAVALVEAVNAVVLGSK